MDGESPWEVLWLEQDIDGIGERKLRMSRGTAMGWNGQKQSPFLPFSLFLLSL